MLKGKRFYVIEDDPTNMAIVNMLLRQREAIAIQDQYNLYSVDSIKKMLPIDMILLDLMLKRGVSGYDIFDAIKADPQLANIPVVIVSASDPALEMRKAQERGFMGYIEKPLDYSTFADLLEAALNGNPVWGERAA